MKPDRIYAHTALKPNPDAMTRLYRFLATMGCAESDVEWARSALFEVGRKNSLAQRRGGWFRMPVTDNCRIQH